MYDHMQFELIDHLKKHFPGLSGIVSDKALKDALGDFWENQIAVCWTLEDVFSALNQDGNAISEQDASEVLWRALDKHEADVGINWEVLQAHAAGMFSKPLSQRQQNRGVPYYLDEKGRVKMWKGKKRE